MQPMKLAWQTRYTPLEAVAVVARHLAARELAASTIAHLKRGSAVLRGVAVDRNLLFIMGDSNILPWADGAIYLGQEQGSNILLPTTLKPSFPANLLEQALKNRFPKLRAPYAVLAHPETIVPLENITLIQHEFLERWLRN